MKTIYRITLIITILPTLLSWTFHKQWLVKKQKGYEVYYTQQDNQNIKAYAQLLKKGIQSVSSFFSSGYQKSFQVYIHPNRQSLDSTWQKDWQIANFQSECWMVASGVATKLDLLSPLSWNKQACEHVYADTEKTQQLISHELIHVFHGQLNSSPDFSNVEGIDWFVEGLATYASGQCDAERIREVKKLIVDNKVPSTLDNFWTGKSKYGLSGSVVLFIDKNYGRTKLRELLSLNTKAAILSALNSTEAALLADWKAFIQKQESV